MRNIELPTYKTIVQNEVFGKRWEKLHNPLLGDIPTTQIAILGRYRTPTQREVIKFIGESARRFDHDSLNSNNGAEGLGCFLGFLPENEIRMIGEGNDISMAHLMNHYGYNKKEEGEKYLEIVNGVLHTDIVDILNERESDEMSAGDYERAIDDADMNAWRIRIRLTKKLTLPNRLEMEYLMDGGVMDSDVFSVYGNFEKYGDVVSQVRMMHNTFGLESLSGKVRNCSRNFLEDRASCVVLAMVECIQNSSGKSEEVSERKRMIIENFANGNLVADKGKLN